MSLLQNRWFIRGLKSQRCDRQKLSVLIQSGWDKQRTDGNGSPRGIGRSDHYHRGHKLYCSREGAGLQLKLLPTTIWKQLPLLLFIQTESPMSRAVKPPTAPHHYPATAYSRNTREIDPHKQRVTQTNMVYLIGLPEHVANQQTLEAYEYCGQYGQITKTMVKKNYFNDFCSYSAYITYTSDEAASLAILGINNLLLGRARIYASYGTNKYCVTFIKFGKCRKADCPFLHRIEEEKEIRQQDNKKLFQQQQLLAKSYVVRNYQSMGIYDEGESPAFPSKHQVVQSLVQDGSIKVKRQNSRQAGEATERSNALKDKSETRSGISTECSPTKTFDSDDELLCQPEIIPKITRKLKHSAKSILGFHKGEPQDAQDITNLILSAIAPVN